MDLGLISVAPHLLPDYFIGSDLHNCSQSVDQIYHFPCL